MNKSRADPPSTPALSPRQQGDHACEQASLFPQHAAARAESPHCSTHCARSVPNADEMHDAGASILERELGDLENSILARGRPAAEWVKALAQCEISMSERQAVPRVRTFLEKCLDKMVAACVEEIGRLSVTEIHRGVLMRASTQIGKALASDFSPFAGKSLIVLMSEPILNSEDARLDGAKELLVQCAAAVTEQVTGLVNGIALREALFSFEQVSVVAAEAPGTRLRAVLRACNLHESLNLDVPGSIVKGLAQRLLQELNDLSFETVPAVLTADGSGKQMCTDGLETLDGILLLVGSACAKQARERWRQLAVSCIQSSKLILRRAGLDIFATLAKIVPNKASAWMVEREADEMQQGGASKSVLEGLTGERAHEKLVDAVRNFVYKLASHPVPSMPEECDEGGRSFTTKAIIDSMLATCVGSDQHPTKDVRDAFRCSLAKLTVTLPHSSDSSEDKGSIEGRQLVALYLVRELLKQLRSKTDGAADLALSIFTLPGRGTCWDQSTDCIPSPKFLVKCAALNDGDIKSKLAYATFDLLFESIVHPDLARNYTQLLHALAVCLHNGACMGRPGTETRLTHDIQHLVTFCTSRLQVSSHIGAQATAATKYSQPDAARREVAEANQREKAQVNDPGAQGSSRSEADRSSRTILMRLLTDVCFFHLRNDTVAQSDKWLKPEKQHDHPIHMDWAKEGRVPMLKMTRSAFLEACERDHNLSELIVSDILRLEGEAQREGRAGCQEHEDEQWLRLQLLRFLHVEQEDTSPTQKVSFQVMQRLWHKLPSEQCCKWFRVLADSGEALTEEVTERAFKDLVCGVDLPMLGKQGFNCFEALFGEINSRHTKSHPAGRMQISGRQVVHKGIKISGQNLVRRRVSWFCVNALRRNVGTITAFDDSISREKEPFDFENDDLHDGRSKTNQLVPLKELFDCHVVEDTRSPQDLRAFEIERVHADSSSAFACDLIGMEELWRVALEALDDGVAARAGELMLALSRKLPVKFLLDFIERIFGELDTSYPLAKLPPSSPYNDTRIRTPLNDDGGTSVTNGCNPSEDVQQMVVQAPDAQSGAAESISSSGRTSVSKPGVRRHGKADRKGLRFSRALSLMQCLLDAHVLQCPDVGILPHRCNVRGRDLGKVILKYSQAKRQAFRPNHHQSFAQIGLDLSQGQPLAAPDVNISNSQQHHRGGFASCNSMSSPSGNGSFAAVDSTECTLKNLHDNVTVKQLLCIARNALEAIRDQQLCALELKIDHRDRTRYPLGKTLQEIGCSPSSGTSKKPKDVKIQIWVSSVYGPGRPSGSSNASLLHLMRPCDGKESDHTVTCRFRSLLESLQQLESRSTDDDLTERERAKLQRQLWHLLASLPTASYLKDQVEEALCGREAWKEVLSKSSCIWRAAYLMQVVESKLQEPETAGFQTLTFEQLKAQDAEKEHRERLRRDFMSNGGAQRVLTLVSQVCGKDQLWFHPAFTSWRVCTPVFLRVLRMLLCYLPLLTGTVLGDTAGHAQGELNSEQHGTARDTNGVKNVDLRDSLANLVHTLLKAAVMLSDRSCMDGNGVDEDDEVVRSILLDIIKLVHTVITERSSLSDFQCRQMVSGLFQPDGGMGNMEAFIRQLLIGHTDHEVRKQAHDTLIAAITMGWETQIRSAVSVKEFSQEGLIDMRFAARHLVISSLKFVVAPFSSVPDEAARSPFKHSNDKTGKQNLLLGRKSDNLKGKEIFEWIEDTLTLKKDDNILLVDEDHLFLLKICLAILTGRYDPFYSISDSPKTELRHGNMVARAEGKKRGHGNADIQTVFASGKPTSGAASGLLYLVEKMFKRLDPSEWRGLVEEYELGNILFEEYLMAADPSSSPVLGWPDTLDGKDARKQGWLPLSAIASCLDMSAAEGSKGIQVEAAAGMEAASVVQSPSRVNRIRSNGSMTGAKVGSLSSLDALVARAHRFVENLPPTTTRTENGPEELFVFDPEHNGLRHGQPALVGLKNRRNTCYINSMLQQLFFIPEFHRWLEGRRQECTKEGIEIMRCAMDVEHGAETVGNIAPEESKVVADKELSVSLLELFTYLRRSKQRFFDPGEFIKACKCRVREPPLLDQAHTQDDTMTFLENLIDALSSIHGAVRADLFKVMEKDRRWVDRTFEPRSITGREKEYLMLEIEDGIDDLDSALRKHFGKELMTGDNRIWNEMTQSKETVWKAPFIEETSLPVVLVVQLKRFKYNMTWDGRMEPHKLNTRVEFGNTLDLSDYVRRQTTEFEATAVKPGDHMYDLQGLVVHSGQTVHSGHYYSFINYHDPTEVVQRDVNGISGTSGKSWAKRGQWYKLDDDVVTPVSEDVVKEESFGGTVESKDQYGDIKRQVHSRSAYVLFYRQRGSTGESGHSHSDSAHAKASSAKAGESKAGCNKRQRTTNGQKQEQLEQGVLRHAKEDQLVLPMNPLQALVDRASLTAAQHALAFDEDFLSWVHDVVVFSVQLLQRTALKKPSFAPQIHPTPKQESSISSPTAAAFTDNSIDAAIPANAQMPPELAAKICDLAVLMLAHVAARTDSRSTRWHSLSKLFDWTGKLLELTPTGSSSFLMRACARPSSPEGEEWRSWIEMLLLKHPENMVREGVCKLLLAAVESLCVEASAKQFPSYGSKTARAQLDTTVHAIEATRTNGSLELNGVGKANFGAPTTLEQLGERLFEEVEAAVINWDKSTLGAAVAESSPGNERERRQLNEYLFVLSSLVEHQGYLSRNLVRKIGQAVLCLSVQLARKRASLAHVFTEAWVRMLGIDENLQRGSELFDLVREDAFVAGSELSLSRWTWMVEWLFRCTTNVEGRPVKLSTSSLPGTLKACIQLHRLRRHLLAQFMSAREGTVFECDYSFSSRLSGNTNSEATSGVHESERQRFLSLEVAGAGDANGTYLYTGHVLHENRAVYTLPVGTNVYVLMPVRECMSKSNVDNSEIHNQQWLLAEMSYGAPKRSHSGLHVLHDAALLTSAFTSGDSKRIAAISEAEIRRILFSGMVDLTPKICRDGNIDYIGGGDREIFGIGDLLETFFPAPGRLPVDSCARIDDSSKTQVFEHNLPPSGRAEFVPAIVILEEVHNRREMSVRILVQEKQHENPAKNPIRLVAAANEKYGWHLIQPQQSHVFYLRVVWPVARFCFCN